MWSIGKVILLRVVFNDFIMEMILIIIFNVGKRENRKIVSVCVVMINSVEVRFNV